MKSAWNVVESMFSFVLFAAITLGIASATYQTFNPNGTLMNWVSHLWQINPALVLMLTGVAFLFKHWLAELQGTNAADILFYAAVLLGFYYGFNLLMAG